MGSTAEPTGNVEDIKTFFLVAIEPEAECVSHENSFEVRSTQELSRVTAGGLLSRYCDGDPTRPKGPPPPDPPAGNLPLPNPNDPKGPPKDPPPDGRQINDESGA